jgi:GNAT superfamily N-acetyltransferase
MREGRYVIRPMAPAEVGTAIEWAAAEGWNPGLHDAGCYAAADPEGFFVGLLDGEPLATISAIRYGASFGFIGFYIVRPEHRGKGYGWQIWNAAMKYLEGRNVGLDGVVAQQENYRKSGFRLAYRNVRYEGAGGDDSPENPDIVPLSSLPFEVIGAYERPFFPAERSAFLRTWIGQPGGHALGIVQKRMLRGYGVIRPCRSGHKIGPLFADTADLAEQLFLALKARARPSDPVFLDTPEVNPMAVALAERHGMRVVFETARMYTRESPDLPLQRVFGLTSFEVG